MNRTEYIGKLNALYVGDKNCLEELITAYDEKDKEIERLNNIIKEVRECIEPIVELDNDIMLKGRVLKPVLEMLDKVDTLDIASYKLQELKGSDKE